jgi:co-chaperonin GroES (HSP10)
MKSVKPIGKWIIAKSLIGGQKTSEAGIIYQEKSRYKVIPAKVVAVGNKITEDIKVGDTILWDLSKIKDGYNGDHIVHQDWIEAVIRE